MSFYARYPLHTSKKSAQTHVLRGYSFKKPYINSKYPKITPWSKKVLWYVYNDIRGNEYVV